MKRTYKIMLVIFIILFMNGSMYQTIHATDLIVDAIPDDKGGYDITVECPYKGSVNVVINEERSVEFWCEHHTCSVKKGSAHIKEEGYIMIAAEPQVFMLDDNGEDVYVLGIMMSIYVAEYEPQPDSEYQEPTSQEHSKENSQVEAHPQQKVEASKSNDSSLASLQIEKGNLTPPFSSDIMEYDMELEGTNEIIIRGTANHDKARVHGLGKLAVKPGTNDIVIECQAEDSSLREYVIHVRVKEKAMATFSYQGATLAAMLYDESAALNDKAFQKKTMSIQNIDLPVWKNEAQGLTLLHLKKGNEADFYIYDEKADKILSIYRPIQLLGKSMIMIDVPEALQQREGMVFTMIDIDHIKLPGWTFQEQAFADYNVLYLMDSQGKVGYYQYSKKEQSIQPYAEAYPMTQTTYKNIVTGYQKKETILYTMILCCVGIGIGLLIWIGYLCKSQHGKEVNTQEE